MTSIAGSSSRPANACKLCVRRHFSFQLFASLSLQCFFFFFPEQIYLLHSFCLLSFSSSLCPLCAHSFFSPNQVGDWSKLTESCSSKNQNRLSRERSQGHNETLGAQGGLSIKSYYAATMAPMSEWEMWGALGTLSMGSSMNV